MTSVLTDCLVSAPRLRGPVYVMELADLVRPPGAGDIEDRS